MYAKIVPVSHVRSKGPPKFFSLNPNKCYQPLGPHLFWVAANAVTNSDLIRLQIVTVGGQFAPVWIASQMHMGQKSQLLQFMCLMRFCIATLYRGYPAMKFEKKTKRKRPKQMQGIVTPVEFARISHTS